jgi:hypothetical protein
MMRYALAETQTEKQKMYFFKKGLSIHIKLGMSGHTCYTLREMIDKALEIERDRMEADAIYNEKKRRSEGTSRTSASQRLHVNAPPAPRPCTAQRATPAPSRGGGTYTANYHRPAPSTNTWRTVVPTPTGNVPFTYFGY